MQHLSAKLQREDDNKTEQKQKRQQKRDNKSTKHMPENIEEGHAIERVWYTVSREPFDIPPDRNYLAFAPEGIAFTTNNSVSGVLGFSIICCTVNAAWGVLGSVQSTRLGGCFSTLT